MEIEDSNKAPDAINSSPRPQPATMAPALSAVSLKHVLDSEIISVTSSMRKNSRWSSSSPFVTVPSHTRDSLGSNLGLRISTPSQNIYGSPNPSARISAEDELMCRFQDVKRSIRDVQGPFRVPSSFLVFRTFAQTFELCRCPHCYILSFR